MRRLPPRPQPASWTALEGATTLEILACGPILSFWNRLRGDANATVFCVIASSLAEKASLMALRPRIGWHIAILTAALVFEVFGASAARAASSRRATCRAAIPVDR